MSNKRHDVKPLLFPVFKVELMEKMFRNSFTASFQLFIRMQTQKILHFSFLQELLIFSVVQHISLNIFGF